MFCPTCGAILKPPGASYEARPATEETEADVAHVIGRAYVVRTSTIVADRIKQAAKGIGDDTLGAVVELFGTAEGRALKGRVQEIDRLTGGTMARAVGLFGQLLTKKKP